MIHWTGLTHTGRFRKNNEDAFLAMIFDEQEVQYLGKQGEIQLDHKDILFAVSDGMGGANAGEFASKIAIEKIVKLAPNILRKAMHDDLEHHQKQLNELFTEINNEMARMGFYYEECRGMGATLSLCWIHGKQLYSAHIGDSRIYHLPANNPMYQITDDHTHVGWLLRTGQITKQQAKVHPGRNILNRSLGKDLKDIEADVAYLELKEGDQLVLCSDGINDGISDRKIEDLLRDPPPKLIDVDPAERLVGEALYNSGRDNLTTMIVGIA